MPNNFFSQFDNLKVLIAGDVMIDRYMSGKVTRVSPEAPVPVVHLQNGEDRLGGAANVALNVKALGATPYLCSIIGQDENAEIFLKLMPDSGLTKEGILQLKDRETTVKTRVIASGQHLLRVDRESTEDISLSDANAFLQSVFRILEKEKIDAIILQDYNKGLLIPTIIEAIIMAAKQFKIPVAVDPKAKNFWSFKGATLFKPNLREIKAQLPFELEIEMDSLQKAADFIRSKLGNRYTLITLSSKGVFMEENRQAAIFPTKARAIADVCGAGDTVISTISLGLALGLDASKMTTLANLAGGQVCERVGVVPVDKAKLIEEFKEEMVK